VPLTALAVLILNDRVLKAAWPGFVTGKLSDVAGLVVTPLAIQALWEVGLWAGGRWVGPSMRGLGVAIIAVGIGFAAVQVWQPATDLYRWGLGAAQWPFLALYALLSGSPSPDVTPVQVVADAEDLLALPALGLTWWVGRRRVARQR
jgi:hypothetical protein